MPDLTGRRILLAGAESGLAPAIAAALSTAGARIALVSLRSDADTAFAVQRLARKTGAELSQAIDGTNEAAVRVMLRQVTKALGGLDAIVVPCEIAALRAYGERELEKSGGVIIIAEDPGAVVTALADSAPTG